MLSTDEVLVADWPRWQAPSRVDGLVAAVAVEAATGWADLLLARESDEQVVWVHTNAAADAYGRAVLERAGVQAACLVPARTHPRRAGLALQVAAHLAAARSDPAARWRPVLTSVEPPLTSPGGVRVPHLVTTRHGDRLDDVVVWEVATERGCRDWLPARASEPTFRAVRESVEARLGQLVRLRGDVRRGRLPLTAAGDRLAAVLSGQPLSIEFVYQHPELVHAVLSTRRRP